MSNYQMCSRCVMDNADDTTIRFDAEGHCNYCTEALQRKELIYFPDERGARKVQELVARLKKEGKGKRYDCMMGISGGLDSSYLAYLGHTWGLRILGVHIDDGFDEPVATENIRKLCEACHIDLVTIAPDAAQYNDLTRAFFRAEVPNVAIPQDNILFACLYDYARRYGVKTFLSGGNFALESILRQRNDSTNVFDMGHIRDIHRRFGTLPMDKLPFMNNYQRILNRYLRGIHSIRPLNLIDYNKQRALQELESFCGFRYYKMKHCENKLTKLIQLYWLVEKFHDDKRHSHLSSMIVSGQMTREEALAELKKPVYDPEDMNRDIDFVLARLGMERAEFDALVARPGKAHADYATSGIYKWFIRLFKKQLIKFKG
ncbi:MAG: N-acetyl sugar amidotransferase [Bacteroidales bacterium]|nr:N-acetyl sugar amidotransferase [Bacteroidales bacterium]